MRIHQLFILLISFFITFPVLGQTQLDLNAKATADFQAADAEMNQVYTKILLLYKNDVPFIKSLRSAQRAWLVFRNAELDALYPVNPNEDRHLIYGSVYPMCYANSKTELTRARTEQLRAWLKGVEEGEVCVGSVKLDRELKKGLK